MKVIKLTDLPNKHDRDPHWEKQSILDRVVYLEQQIAAGDRLDGWSLKGAKKELNKLNKLKNK
jgi:hypothetical protein|tara:strand:+ start:69 stop:257 length:189 start_codon:yes stop_codon:yes gene_type:complete